VCCATTLLDFDLSISVPLAVPVAEESSTEGEVPRSRSGVHAEALVKKKMQIKQPCILIFDSLAGATRSRVYTTLREYLKVEYKVRSEFVLKSLDISDLIIIFFA
jgi:Ulp1 family protease